MDHLLCTDLTGWSVIAFCVLQTSRNPYAG